MNKMQFLETDFKKSSAMVELTQAKAMKILLTNKDLAAEIHISGMVMGVANTNLLLPVIENQIKEIKKYLKGQKNNWE